MGRNSAKTRAAIKNRIKQNNAHLFNDLGPIGEEEDDYGREEMDSDEAVD